METPQQDDTTPRSPSREEINRTVLSDQLQIALYAETYGDACAEVAYLMGQAYQKDGSYGQPSSFETLVMMVDEDVQGIDSHIIEGPGATDRKERAKRLLKTIRQVIRVADIAVGQDREEISRSKNLMDTEPNLGVRNLMGITGLVKRAKDILKKDLAAMVRMLYEYQEDADWACLDRFTEELNLIAMHLIRRSYRPRTAVREQSTAK